MAGGVECAGTPKNQVTEPSHQSLRMIHGRRQGALKPAKPLHCELKGRRTQSALAPHLGGGARTKLALWAWPPANGQQEPQLAHEGRIQPVELPRRNCYAHQSRIRRCKAAGSKSQQLNSPRNSGGPQPAQLRPTTIATAHPLTDLATLVHEPAENRAQMPMLVLHMVIRKQVRQPPLLLGAPKHGDNDKLV